MTCGEIELALAAAEAELDQLLIIQSQTDMLIGEFNELIYNLLAEYEGCSSSRTTGEWAGAEPVKEELRRCTVLLNRWRRKIKRYDPFLGVKDEC